MFPGWTRVSSVTIIQLDMWEYSSKSHQNRANQSKTQNAPVKQFEIVILNFLMKNIKIRVVMV